MIGNAYLCDNCGKAAPVRGAVDWREVRRVGIDITTYADEPGPWMFCCELCILEYYTKRRAVEAKRQEIIAASEEFERKTKVKP